MKCIPEGPLQNFPASYKQNSPEEQHLVSQAENFWSQFSFLYPDRKPLLLAPQNECGVEKFVCTTLRPTLLPHHELYMWDACAHFVADHLDLKQVPSPNTVLQRQYGNSFDFSLLLCSLLLGCGYDAYCVCGYASRETTYHDDTSNTCPLLMHTGKVETPPTRRYMVRPPRQLYSKFDQQQQERKMAEEHKKKMQTDGNGEDLVDSGPDLLHGQRVHCWLLVLAGQREVPGNFFIEPFSGEAYPTTDSRFLGVESVWNQHNCWVNMQNCRNGCKDMLFDLGDSVRWEFILPWSSHKPGLHISIVNENTESDGEEEEEEEEEEEGEAMKKVRLSKWEFEFRCPSGRKVMHYRRARFDTFAPYLRNDGLVTRLSVYKDHHCTNLKEVKEWFQNRQDKLEQRENDASTGLTEESFAFGHSAALLKHTYNTRVANSDRKMAFNSRARIDGLIQREETPTSMIEMYDDRPDLLLSRHVQFGRLEKRLAPAGSVESNRTILSINERYGRNWSRPADQDVAEKSFLLCDGRIQLTYHRREDDIVPAWQNFLKTEVNALFHLHNFNVSVSSFMIVYVLQVKELLQLRKKEEESINFVISIYDPERNVNTKKYQEEQLPLGTRGTIGSEGTTYPEALRSGWQKTRYFMAFLKDVQNMFGINSKYGDDCYLQEMALLLEKQQWFKNNVYLSKEDEEEYHNFCTQTMFRIHVVEIRLNRLKENGPKKFRALEEKLKTDPRFASYLQGLKI
uniref:Dynein regulatory complex subunit 7 n=1 Tax=Eptatretus burgeri TaxID=7764 RepID=A0A8C4PX23_EPTBU